MKRRVALLLILVFGIVPIAAAQITLKVREADGETPFDCNNDIMVGTKLTVIVSSDSNDYWSGGLFVTGQDRALGTLAGRGLDPNARDYTDSHYEDAGNSAIVTAWKDSSIWGFDLYTFYPVDGNSDSNSTVVGDWFIIGYEADEVGDCNVGFYDYSISWDDPNYFLSFSHSPTRDIYSDEKVNFIDFAIFASRWDANDCNDPNWCDGVDLDRDGEVNCNDLGLFVEYWLWDPAWTQPIETMMMGGGMSLELRETAAEFYDVTDAKAEMEPELIEQLIKWLEEIWLGEDLPKGIDRDEWQRGIERIIESLKEELQN